MAKEVRQHNVHQRQLKDEEAAREKEEDKRLIQMLVEKEKEMKRFEEWQKQNFQAETKAFWQSVRNRSKELALNQKALDELLEKQAEAQWAKRAAVWAKEEEGRIELMKSVYENRYVEVENRRMARENERREKGKGSEQLKKDALDMQIEETERIKEQFRKAKAYQADLISQMAEKHNRHQAALLKRAEEDRERKRQELEYNMKIMIEKEKADALLEQIRRLKETICDY